MLTQLSITNFGLIDDIEIIFHSNLNIFTGATGAGKSIIIDGLRFALGERLRTSQIRDPNRPCIVEAVFSLNETLLSEQADFMNFVDADERLLIIYREAQADGKTKIKVNGKTVTVAQLKVLGNHLMDFHGPHDHQLLLAEEYHLLMLDRLINFGDLKNDYDEGFKKFVAVTLQINDLQSMALSRDREMDMLAHQIKELEQVPLEEDAYDQLMRDYGRIQNIERLAEAASSLLQLLEDEDVGITENIGKAFPFSHVLSEWDPSAGMFEEYLANIQVNVADLARELRDYRDSLAFEPQEAQEINRKYDIYDDLKRKYGSDLEQVRAFYEKARHKLHLLEDWEQNDAELKEKIKVLGKKIKDIARRISGLRKASAKILENTIEQELMDLGIKHVQFEVRFEEVAFDKNGIDQVRFFISPNAGEDLKPLAQIVSSGEAARLMLALKRALTQVDPIPVLIFDEIDAQIGGRLGTITGQKLRELSNDRQVILITHLPQIAAFGEKHFHVDKVVKKGKTFTDVTELDGEDRIHELAQMMGGGKYSDTVREHAEEMLASAQKCM